MASRPGPDLRCRKSWLQRGDFRVPAHRKWTERDRSHRQGDLGHPQRESLKRNISAQHVTRAKLRRAPTRGGDPSSKSGSFFGDWQVFERNGGNPRDSRFFLGGQLGPMLPCSVAESRVPPRFQTFISHPPGGGFDLERSCTPEYPGSSRPHRHAHPMRTPGFRPEVGLILGTGLGDLGSPRSMWCAKFPTATIPHLVESTATSHARAISCWGILAGRKVIAMQGRVHYYEGILHGGGDPAGAGDEGPGLPSVLLMSNAVGGMNPQHGSW